MELDTGYQYLNQISKISHRTLTDFIDMCMERHERAAVQPGAAVGAVGAQSIGEPGTQMTLKTFHFAGIAHLEITQGVPRVKEIINASRVISTPVITCLLKNDEALIAARVIKGRIEQTFLRDIASWIQDNWSNRGSYITLKIDFDAIHNLHLNIKMADIARSIVKTKKLQLKPLELKVYKNFIRIDVNSVAKTERGSKIKALHDSEIFTRVHFVKRLLPDVPVCGYPGASRAVIEEENGKHKLLVEGYGLRNCMITQGVEGLKTRSNSIIEMRDILGIEAARTTIIMEISEVMKGMDIDPRHMKLLADVMTYRGEVLGITRFGLSKMRDSVLQLASFEKTPDHLFEAAWHAKKDKIEGVSECIIMGQSMTQGTGAFQIVKTLEMEEGMIGKKDTVFEDAWQGVS